MVEFVARQKRFSPVLSKIEAWSSMEETEEREIIEETKMIEKLIGNAEQQMPKRSRRNQVEF